MRGSIASLILGVFLTSAIAQQAAAQATTPGGTATATFSFKASDLSITDVAASLTTKAKTPVLVEPGIADNFSGSFNQASVEQVLDAVATAANVKWQKLFIPGETAKTDELTKAQEQATVLDQLKSSATMVVYDPVAKQQITFTRQAADSAQASASAAELKLRPVYLISSKEAKPAAIIAKATPVASADVAAYNDLGEQQKQAFLTMTPEQRTQAIEQSMYADMRANPTERAAYEKARHDTFDTLRHSNSPVFQQWRESMHATGGNGGGRGNRGQGGVQNGGQQRQHNEADVTH